MMRLSVPIYQLKRRAKLLARDEKVPLHEAQDRIAREEGYFAWSALSSRMATNWRASALLPRLSNGDMLLLGARPGHGKTLWACSFYSMLAVTEDEPSSSRWNIPIMR